MKPAIGPVYGRHHQLASTMAILSGIIGVLVLSGERPHPSQKVVAQMTTITSVLSVMARRLIIPVALAGGVILAPAFAILDNFGAGTVSARPAGGSHHSGPDYWSITGARVGAAGEQEVSTYGGSHKHLRVEQQLYGPGIVEVPHVDTSVHQSR
jgi:hypothetical protein